jgi:DNA-binding transcriptional MerR regulator
MFTIGQLAKKTGSLTITIRYYERKGLLTKPKRNAKGYRMYDESDVERLRFIRHCRRHGFTMEEIKKLLDLREAPDSSCGVVDKILDTQIQKLEESLKQTIQLRDELIELRNKCPHNVSISDCGIMRGLIDQSLCPCFNSPDIHDHSHSHPYEDPDMEENEAD